MPPSPRRPRNSQGVSRRVALCSPRGLSGRRPPVDGLEKRRSSMTLAAAAAIAPGGLDDLSRAGLDVVTLAALVGLYYRRHRRQDLVAVYVAFNVGLFAILTFLAHSTLSAGVGCGVFGVLSIIRLRSEEYNNVEMAYFFLSLATALVNALPGRPFLMSLAMDIAILMTMLVVTPRAWAAGRSSAA